MVSTGGCKHKCKVSKIPDFRSLAARACCTLFVPWLRWEEGQIWTWRARFLNEVLAVGRMQREQHLIPYMLQIVAPMKCLRVAMQICIFNTAPMKCLCVSKE